MILLYGAVKFLAYSAWCHAGLRLAGSSADAASSLLLGAARWGIGLLFGIVIFFAVGSIDAAAAARTYFAVYTPVRIVELVIMLFVIAVRVQPDSMAMANPRLRLWCVGGMLVSFLTDVLSPEGVQGRFCVGRCLC